MKQNTQKDRNRDIINTKNILKILKIPISLKINFFPKVYLI